VTPCRRRHGEDVAKGAAALAQPAPPPPPGKEDQGKADERAERGEREILVDDEKG
jgi:hypothetical protein